MWRGRSSRCGGIGKGVERGGVGNGMVEGGKREWGMRKGGAFVALMIKEKREFLIGVGSGDVPKVGEL